MHLDDGYRERNLEHIARYHVDVLDDEQRCYVYTFLSAWDTSWGWLHVLHSTLLPHFSEFMSIGLLPITQTRVLVRYSPAIALNLS
jgi:hypothetical protein